MLLNKYITYTFIIILLISAILIDYNIFTVKNKSNEIDNSIYHKSSIILQIRSNKIKENNHFYKKNKNYLDILRSDLLNLIYSKILNDEINKFYLSDFSNRYNKSEFEKYFVFDYVENVKDINTGNIVIVFDVYSSLFDNKLFEDLTKFIDGIINKKKLIFKIIDNYTLEFIKFDKAINQNKILQLQNKFFEEINKNLKFEDNITSKVLFNKFGVHNQNDINYIFNNFVPVFTIISWILIFIIFILSLIFKKSKLNND